MNKVGPTPATHPITTGYPPTQSENHELGLRTGDDWWVMSHAWVWCMYVVMCGSILWGHVLQTSANLALHQVHADHGFSLSQPIYVPNRDIYISYTMYLSIIENYIRFNCKTPKKSQSNSIYSTWSMSTII